FRYGVLPVRIGQARVHPGSGGSEQGAGQFRRAARCVGGGQGRLDIEAFGQGTADSIAQGHRAAAGPAHIRQGPLVAPGPVVGIVVRAGDDLHVAGLLTGRLVTAVTDDHITEIVFEDTVVKLVAEQVCGDDPACAVGVAAHTELGVAGRGDRPEPVGTRTFAAPV